MIVSQTCDIANDEQATVARVRPFRHANKPELQEDIRHGNTMPMFYLPDYPKTSEEGFATLTELTVLSKKLLETHKAQRRKSLSPEGLRTFQSFIERFFGREAMPDDVIRIITAFSRSLHKTEIEDKIERIYYDYSSDWISLLVALSELDDSAQASVEVAKRFADNSIEHSYELRTECKLIDKVSLRDIEGFREFR